MLRLDDRGTGKSGGNFATATYSDKVADALAAIAWLKARADVAAARIGVIGHSEGVNIGSLAASQSQDVAFVVMLAGPGVPGPEALKQQGIDTVRAAGGSDAVIASQVEVQTKLLAIFRNTENPATRREQARALSGDAAAADMQIAMMESRTIQDLLAYDPGPVLRKLGCPVLAINGSLDTQVAARQNLPAIAAALAQSPSRDWQVTQLPGLNHLFQSAKTGGVGEYSQIEETLSPVALQAIQSWLAASVPPRR